MRFNELDLLINSFPTLISSYHIQLLTSFKALTLCLNQTLFDDFVQTGIIVYKTENINIVWFMLIDMCVSFWGTVYWKIYNHQFKKLYDQSLSYLIHSKHKHLILNLNELYAYAKSKNNSQSLEQWKAKMQTKINHQKHKRILIIVFVLGVIGIILLFVIKKRKDKHNFDTKLVSKNITIK